MNKIFFSNFFLLLLVFEQSKKTGSMDSSTTRIAESLGISQQSVSRKIMELRKADLIEKKSSVNGSELILTKKAVYSLKTVYFKMNKCFTQINAKIQGKIVSGMGQGAYYICQKNYSLQFQKKLGFSPFCGTLNVEVNENELNAALLGLNPLKLEGFKTAKRTFGALECFKAKINGKIIAGIVFPERTSHSRNIVELIAPYNLRKKLNLKDGSEIYFELIV
ncbi:MAG: CTP-dependent riboflavin kinase [Candidatus Diapherotrites archaeon]|nr:CTP-dependent riboflavin kinase [Candidatus Diapherotrites archaeon]